MDPLENPIILENLIKWLVKTNNAKELKSLRALSTFHYSQLNTKYFDWLNITIDIQKLRSLNRVIHYSETIRCRCYSCRTEGTITSENWDPTIGHVFRTLRVKTLVLQDLKDWFMNESWFDQFLKSLKPYITTIQTERSTTWNPETITQASKFIKSFVNLKWLSLSATEFQDVVLEHELFLLGLNLDSSLKIEFRVQFREGECLILKKLAGEEGKLLKSLIRRIGFRNSIYNQGLRRGKDGDYAKLIKDFSISHEICNDMMLGLRFPKQETLQVLAPYIKRLSISPISVQDPLGNYYWPNLRRMFIAIHERIPSRYATRNILQLETRNFPNLECLTYCMPHFILFLNGDSLDEDNIDEDNLKFTFHDLKNLKSLTLDITFRRVYRELKVSLGVKERLQRYLKQLLPQIKVKIKINSENLA